MSWDLLTEKPKLAYQNTEAANGRADFLTMDCLYSLHFSFSFSPSPLPTSRYFCRRPTFRALSHLSTLDSWRSPGGKEETTRSLHLKNNKIQKYKMKTV